MDIEALLPMWLIVCPLVFLAGLVDSVAGGGGLISLPAYLLAGLPPHAALATNKCGNSLGTWLATARFIKNKQFDGSTALISVVMALAGSWLGTRLNLIFPADSLYYLMLAVVPVLALFLLFKRDFGAESRVDRFSRRALLALCAVVAFVLGLYDGFFGPGAGTFMILSLTGLCGYDLLTASGNAKIMNSASMLASLTTFALAGQVWWSVGLPAAAFNLVGAYIGSSMALKGGGKVIRPMFLLVLAILMGKLIWDLFTG